MATAKAQPKLVDKIVAVVRRDPQKAAILTVLVAILVVLQVRLLLSNKSGPSSATASTTPAFLTPDKNGAGGTVGGTDGMSPLKAWIATDASRVERNLFVVNLDKFPQDSGHISAVRPQSALFWDDLAKSLSLQADVKKERQILVENLQQQAGQIRLQSTLMGAHPKAVINGDLVGEGSIVACGTGDSRVTFRVLKIEARRIVIEREGIKLEIQMK